MTVVGTRIKQSIITKFSLIFIWGCGDDIRLMSQADTLIADEGGEEVQRMRRLWRLLGTVGTLSGP